MKVSEIKIEDVAHYLKLDFASLEDEEKKQLTYMLENAKEYIKRYTGLSNKEIEKHDDFAIVVFILATEFYENRQYQSDKQIYVNKVVQSILDMHSNNLL